MRPDKRLWAELKAVQFPFGLAILLNILNGLVLIGQAYLLSQIVNRIFLKDQALSNVQNLLFGLALLAIGRFALGWSASIAEHQVTSDVQFTLRQRLFDHALKLGPLQMGQERSGEIINTLTEGIGALDEYFSKYLPQLFTSLLIPLSILVFILPLDIWSGVVLLCTAPLLPFFMALIGIMAGSVSKKQWKTMSLLSAHFLDTLQGLTTLKIFDRSEQQVETIGAISDDYRITTMKVLRVAFLSAFALEMITTLSVAIIAVEIGLRLLSSQIEFAQAFFILILAPEFYQPIRNLGTSFHTARSGADAAERIFEFLSIEPKVIPTGTQPVPLDPFAIHFEKISYTYTERTEAALQDIDFTLHAGEKLALVGATGAGKTTVANLLLRFIDPTSGQILVGDVPLPEIDIEAWRNQVAWVSQNPYLYHASIADNLRIAKPDATQDELEQAAYQAHILDFIEGLPDSWQTSIAERGSRLSGGQAQRLAIARAYLKDAPLLIWDEATAHLDPLIEEKIRLSLHELMAERTVLMIAHRLATVQQADRILIVENGKIVDSGTHFELMAHSQRYQEMVENYAGAADF